MSDAPTPKPPSIRANTRKAKVGDSAENMADRAYNMAAIESTRFLPQRSLKGPAINMAMVAVSVKELTAHPNSNFDSLNSGSINLTTPEMTDASNPIRKPPSATIDEMRTIWLLL